uniref:Uncharacterized protein n=1 Tax=Anguilla anguilla TaxID=7936 RepID=A0A0E9QPY8_ANGAN
MNNSWLIFCNRYFTREYGRNISTMHPTPP